MGNSHISHNNIDSGMIVVMEQCGLLEKMSNKGGVDCLKVGMRNFNCCWCRSHVHFQVYKIYGTVSSQSKPFACEKSQSLRGVLSGFESRTFSRNKTRGISQNAGFRGFSHGFVVVQVVFTILTGLLHLDLGGFGGVLKTHPKSWVHGRDGVQIII